MTNMLNQWEESMTFQRDKEPEDWDLLEDLPSPLMMMSDMDFPASRKSRMDTQSSTEWLMSAEGSALAREEVIQSPVELKDTGLIRSTLKESDLVQIMSMYYIPDSVVLRTPALGKILSDPKDGEGGIILGPSVLGRSEAFTSMVFPLSGKVVLETTANFGLVYTIFLVGVKMDPTLVKRSGRKELVIGTIIMLLPFIITTGLAFYLKDFISKSMTNWMVLIHMGAFLSMTSFAALVPILYDFRLINTEMGRLAATSALLNDMCIWLFMVSFTAMQAFLNTPIKGLWAILAMAGLVMFAFFVIRPLTLWVIKHTPEGQLVDEVYIFFILVGVLVVGFFSDMIGANPFSGALMLGLVIPGGPPLGKALVEKLECIVVRLLLPLFYVVSGLQTDVFTIRDITMWGFWQLILVAGCLAKFLGALLSSLYFNVPFNDAVSLAFMVNCKGITEMITYNFWNGKIIGKQSFAILVLSTVLVTAIVAPLAIIFYDPSKRYVVQKRRTIQHNGPDEELRIMACVHTQENVPTLINVLEASNATDISPLYIISLHLVQLVGQSSALLINHGEFSRTTSSVRSSGGTDIDRIINAFTMFEQQHEGGNITVHPFSSVAPYSVMHNDVCMLALEQRVSFIIIPFHKQPLVNGEMAVNNAIRTLNQNVLANAPCSVGILVENKHGGAMCTLVGRFSHKVAMLFFGGNDDREALAYTARMAEHPGVSITVMRFIPSGTISDHSRERKLDVESLDEFKYKNAGNNRIMCREAVVNDVEEAVDMIRHLINDNYDLLLVGMRHETNPLINEGITEWTDCPELGFVGDLLASPDFGNMVSVMVIRQQAPVYFNGLTAMDGNNTSIKILEQLCEAIPMPRRTEVARPTVRLRSPQSS